MLAKVEGIQKRAVKWILAEQDHHYNDFEYLKRLKDLDILPMEYKFVYTDLVQFYKIYHGLSVVKLPSYLQPVTAEDRCRLRPHIIPVLQNQPEGFEIPDLALMRTNRYDSASLKCVLINPSNILKSSFFFRTHLLWNDLTPSIRNLNDMGEFKTSLMKHLWVVTLGNQDNDLHYNDPQ